MFSSSAIFPHQVLVTAHHVTMPRARSQQVLQKSSYAQATIEWPWSSSEFLFLLARCTCRLGVLSVECSNLTWKAATEKAKSVRATAPFQTRLY